jgi:hypothetical protein
MADHVPRNAEGFSPPSTAHAHYARLRLTPVFLASSSNTLRPRLASAECQRDARLLRKLRDCILDSGLELLYTHPRCSSWMTYAAW